MPENNKLLKYEDSIFRRIVKWFKNLFNKPINTKTDEIKEVDIEKQDDKEVSTLNQEDDKKKFFELYENVKSGKVDVNSLTLEELEKFNQIIGEEIILKNNKLEGLKLDNAKLEEEIKNKEKEKERIKAQINA